MQLRELRESNYGDDFDTLYVFRLVLENIFFPHGSNYQILLHYGLE